MTDEQWRTAWKLYQSGQSLPKEQLHRLLEESGAEDVVRDKVLDLLEQGAPVGLPDPDPAGQQFGRYVVIERLGAGGMGEVYAARDVELGRQVAIKFLRSLPNGNDADLERFIREAKAASSMNHPGIVTIHEIIRIPGRLAIVMELVDGASLRQLLGSPLPVDRILHIGAQIAQALAAAHARGIVHCDIKPENLMVRSDGIVKVLDFGLARDLGEVATRSVLPAGTLQYVSPETSQGAPASPASDIFAFGIVLYELAAGRHPFATGSLFETLKGINEGAPPPPSASNSFVPRQLDALILQMLDKVPGNRPSAAQAAALLESRFAGMTAEPAAASARAAGWSSRLAARLASVRRWLLPAVTAAALAALGYLYLDRRAPAAEQPLVQFSITPSFRSRHVNVAVSPDGTRIAYADHLHGLFLRSMSSFQEQLLVAVDASPLSPFWSPDGRSLGFINWGDGVRRIDFVGDRPSPPTTIAPRASNYSGASWSRLGVVLFVPESTGTGIHRISASGGGTPVPVTRLNRERGEITHRYPQFLPDGKRFLYWVWSTTEENTGIYVGSLDASEKLPPGPLVRTWREARFSDTGHLLYLQRSTLMARPFDPEKLTFTGDAVALPDAVGLHWENTGRAMFSVAGRRALVYQEALSEPKSRIVIRNREGKIVSQFPASSAARSVSISPRQTHLVFQSEDENTLESLWMLDLTRGIPTRFAKSAASDQAPAWSPDGRRVVFSSNRRGTYDLYVRNADGSGEDELLAQSGFIKTMASWTPDGKYLAYTEEGVETRGDLWVVAMQGDRTPKPLIRTREQEFAAVFRPVPDPQGRDWFLYVSDKAGVPAIYLRPFVPPDAASHSASGAGNEVRISARPASSPCWRGDGREAYFVESGEGGILSMMAVDVKPGTPLVVSAPRKLFDLPGALASGNNCAAFADGQRFAFVEPQNDDPAGRINVLLNWTAKLKK